MSARAGLYGLDHLMRYYIAEATALTPEFEIVSGGFRLDQGDMAFARFEDRHENGPAMATRALILANDKDDARAIFTDALATGTMYTNIVGLHGSL